MGSLIDSIDCVRKGKYIKYIYFSKTQNALHTGEKRLISSKVYLKPSKISD